MLNTGTLIDVVIVANSGDAHSNEVQDELTKLGKRAVRFNFSDLADTDFTYQTELLQISSFGQLASLHMRTSIWWRRTGSVATGHLDVDNSQLAVDEAPHIFVGSLLSMGVRFIDDPFDTERAELKLFQLAIASSLGFLTPRHVVTNSFAAAQDFLEGASVVAKPLSPGLGIAPFVDLITSEDLESVHNFPTLFQELILAEADLRVVVVGDEAWTWRRMRGSTTLDWRQVDPLGTQFSLIEGRQTAEHSLMLTNALGLTMSITDWLETTSGPVFLEINPQGSWLFLERAKELIVPSLARHLVGSHV